MGQMVKNTRKYLKSSPVNFFSLNSNELKSLPLYDIHFILKIKSRMLHSIVLYLCCF